MEAKGKKLGQSANWDNLWCNENSLDGGILYYVDESKVSHWASKIAELQWFTLLYGSGNECASIAPYFCGIEVPTFA